MNIRTSDKHERDLPVLQYAIPAADIQRIRDDSQRRQQYKKNMGNLAQSNQYAIQIDCISQSIDFSLKVSERSKKVR